MSFEQRQAVRDRYWADLATKREAWLESIPGDVMLDIVEAEERMRRAARKSRRG